MESSSSVTWDQDGADSVAIEAKTEAFMDGEAGSDVAAASDGCSELELALALMGRRSGRMEPEPEPGVTMPLNKDDGDSAETSGRTASRGSREGGRASRGSTLLGCPRIVCCGDCCDCCEDDCSECERSSERWDDG